MKIMFESNPLKSRILVRRSAAGSRAPEEMIDSPWDVNSVLALVFASDALPKPDLQETPCVYGMIWSATV